MQVLEIRDNNFTFGARVPKLKPTKAKDAYVYLQGEMSSQVTTLVDVVNKLHESLRKLSVQKTNQQAQSILENLRANQGLKGVFETKTEGLILDFGNDRNLIASTHGQNALRLRTQNARTGEIEDSLFIQDKRVAKTDTKKGIPAKISYLTHGDINPSEFSTGLQEQLDAADFSLLKIRRELSKPEIRTEIDRVGFAQLSPTGVFPARTVDATPEKPVRVPMRRPERLVTREMTPERAALVNTRLKSFSETEKPQEVAPKPKRTHASSFRILSDDEMNLVGDVKTAFARIYSMLFSEDMAVNTRSLIKNGYEKLAKGKAGSKIINFAGIGKDGADVGVNVVKFQDWELLHLRLTDKSGKVRDVIINQQGKVTRSSTAIKDSAANRSIAENKVYTRSELDELEIVPLLQRLKTELAEYNTYLEARISRSKDWKTSHARGGKVKKPEAPVTDAEVKPKRGRKPKSEKVAVSPLEELVQRLNSQIEQIRADFNKKLDDLQANLKKLIDKK